MARKPSSSLLLRCLLRTRNSKPSFSSSSVKTLTTVPQIPSSLSFEMKPSFVSTPSHLIYTLYFSKLSRSFCSSSSSSPAEGACMVILHSEEMLQDSLKKARDDGLPSLFFFTAAWCGPSELLYPEIEKAKHAYPHVTIYKVDVDQAYIQDLVVELKISFVPTIVFFQNGKRAATMVGNNDLARLNKYMERFYNTTNK